jgi:hypothetical protein
VAPLAGYVAFVVFALFGLAAAVWLFLILKLALGRNVEAFQYNGQTITIRESRREHALRLLTGSWLCLPVWFGSAIAFIALAPGDWDLLALLCLPAVDVHDGQGLGEPLLGRARALARVVSATRRSAATGSASRAHGHRGRGRFGTASASRRTPNA